MKTLCLLIIKFLFISKCTADKKYCWYFEEGYPIYFICRSYEDCCDTKCCVRALSLQKIWYFWLLLLFGILLCCGVGMVLRRRAYSSAIGDEATFDVSFTNHPPSTTGLPYECELHSYRGPPAGQLFSPSYPSHPHTLHLAVPYPPAPPPLPAYSSQPPPSYEQALKDSQCKSSSGELS